MPYSKETLIELLIKYYGAREEESSPRFGGLTARAIAKELLIDQGAYSKLVSLNNYDYKQTAYKNVCKRLEFLIQIKDLQEQNSYLNRKVLRRKRFSLILGVTIFLVAVLILLALFKNLKTQDNFKLPEEYVHIDSIPLETAFQRIFRLQHNEIVPYQKEKIPENFPCIKYQGQWVLDADNRYKIPIPYEVELGFHYQAIEVNMFGWCEIGDEEGDTLVALEVLKNEIWYDLKKRKFEEFEKDWESYNKIVFGNDPDFIPIATVHSLFRDRFEIKDSLYRFSERLARYEPIVFDISLISDQIPTKIKDDLKEIVQEITRKYIGQLIITKCDPCELPEEHPNVEDGTKLAFHCEFEFNHRDNIKVVPYTKTLMLKDQYIDQ